MTATALLFFRVGDKDIYLADFHAVVAAGTDVRIENYRISRANEETTAQNTACDATGLFAGRPVMCFR
jgi:predicted ABC-class ATPase